MELLEGNVIIGLCFVIGSGLMILEAFMPGFGVAGVTGVILEIVAIVLAWIGHGTVFALCVTGAALVFVGLTIFLSYRSAMKGRISRSPLILKETETPVSEQPDENRLNSWLNREGIALSALRPGGFVEIDGRKLTAASRGTFIPKGARVRVIGMEGDHLVIQETA